MISNPWLVSKNESKGKRRMASAVHAAREAGFLFPRVTAPSGHSSPAETFSCLKKACSTSRKGLVAFKQPPANNNLVYGDLKCKGKVH